MNKAVILLSGGLDSATTAAIARAEGFELYALSVDYGQRHRHELAAAARVAEAMGVKRHVTLAVDLSRFGGSALTYLPLHTNAFLLKLLALLFYIDPGFL